jgi:phage tail-like protein
MTAGPAPMGPALLPPTSTPFEFAMGRASGEGLPLPVPLRELWDPWKCPMALLPWLAWALSVDIWDDRWPEPKKRHVVATALPRLQRKGTPAGLREYVDIAGGRVAKVITPPSKMFLMPNMTAEEYERFLAMMPQLRVFPFRHRGMAHGGAFTANFRVNDLDRFFPAERARPEGSFPIGVLADEDGTEALLDEESGEPLEEDTAPPWAADPVRWTKCCVFPTHAPLRYGRRTFYWDRGVEQECRRLERTRVGEDGKTAYDFETTFIPARAPYTLFPGEEETGGRLHGRIFLPPADAVSRVISTRVERRYDDPGNDRLTLKALPLGAGMDPVHIRPRWVAQKGTAKAGFYPSGGRQSGLQHIGSGPGEGAMPITTAGDRLFERLYLHDPERLPEKRPRTTHLGYVRLGMPPYWAETLIETPGKRSIWAAGEFVRGFHLASNAPARVGRMVDAVRLAKAARDKVLVDTKAHRPSRVGDRRKVGTGFVGDFVKR